MSVSDETIEELTGEVMELVDEAIADLPIDDAIDVVDAVRSDLEFRRNALVADKEHS